MNRAQRRRAKAPVFANNYTPQVFPRPRRTILAHSVRLACANWRVAHQVTPEWWARALEAR